MASLSKVVTKEIWRMNFSDKINARELNIVYGIFWREQISIYTKPEEQLTVATLPGDIKVATASYEREKKRVPKLACALCRHASPLHIGGSRSSGSPLP